MIHTLDVVSGTPPYFSPLKGGGASNSVINLYDTYIYVTKRKERSSFERFNLKLSRLFSDASKQESELHTTETATHRTNFEPFAPVSLKSAATEKTRLNLHDRPLGGYRVRSLSLFWMKVKAALCVCVCVMTDDLDPQTHTQLC